MFIIAFPPKQISSAKRSQWNGICISVYKTTHKKGILNQIDIF